MRKLEELRREQIKQEQIKQEQIIENEKYRKEKIRLQQIEDERKKMMKHEGENLLTQIFTSLENINTKNILNTKESDVFIDTKQNCIYFNIDGEYKKIYELKLLGKSFPHQIFTYNIYDFLHGVFVNLPPEYFNDIVKIYHSLILTKTLPAKVLKKYWIEIKKDVILFNNKPYEIWNKNMTLVNVEPYLQKAADLIFYCLHRILYTVYIYDRRRENDIRELIKTE